MNLFGAVVTTLVAIVFLVTKFTHGAWIIIVLIPGLLFMFFRTHAHYRRVARVMSTAGSHPNVHRHPIQTVVLVDNVHRETVRLVEFAKSMKVPWKALHVAAYPDQTPEIQRKWKERIGEGELVILDSPYRTISRPIREYVLKLLHDNPDGFVHIVMGQLRTGNPVTQLLHQNTHLIEQLALQDLERVVLSVVPFQLASEEAQAAAQAAAAPKTPPRRRPRVEPASEPAAPPAEATNG
jgi:hypothetical protein